MAKRKLPKGLSQKLERVRRKEILRGIPISKKKLVGRVFTRKNLRTDLGRALVSGRKIPSNVQQSLFSLFPPKKGKFIKKVSG